MSRLEGRVAIITGAGAGFGAATARRFLEEGARVLLADVDGDAAGALAEELGSGAAAFTVDVRHADRMAEMVSTAEEEFGGLDILINNAGLTHAISPIEDLTEEEFDRVMDINVKGVWLGIKYGVPALRRRGRGVILNTSSVGALMPRPRTGAYFPSKAAVANLTQMLAGELGPEIRVNCVCPVAAPTNFNLNAVGGDEQLFQSVNANLPVSDIPLGRPCDPLDVANAFVFLASDEAAFLSGVVLPIDGGRSAGGGGTPKLD